MLTNLFSEALSVAIQAHHGQMRKGTNIPYIAHPMGVASIALEFGANETQAIAALLHDVLEDGGPEFTDVIRNAFGEEVLAIVEGCTDGYPDKNGVKADWWARKKCYLDHLSTASEDVLLVSGADKLHNARAILSDLEETGESVFGRFKAGKEGTLWYYRSLTELFLNRQAPMAKQLDDTVSRIEQIAVYDDAYEQLILKHFGEGVLEKVKTSMGKKNQPTN